MKPETPPHLLQTGRAVGLVDTQDMGGVISVAWRPRRDHDYVLADIVAVLGSINVVAAELDR